MFYDKNKFYNTHTLHCSLSTWAFFIFWSKLGNLLLAWGHTKPNKTTTSSTRAYWHKNFAGDENQKKQQKYFNFKPHLCRRDCSVTRWLHYLFNIWSFKEMKIGIIVFFGQIWLKIVPSNKYNHKNMAKYFYNFAKLANFRTIWSHWSTWEEQKILLCSFDPFQ